MENQLGLLECREVDVPFRKNHYPENGRLPWLRFNLLVGPVGIVGGLLFLFVGSLAIKPGDF
jgi:hypothetical protein